MVDHAGGSVAAPIFRRVAEMALKYKGLTPRGTERADVAELARRPDPANVTYEMLRQASGQRPPVQEVTAKGPAPSGKVRIPDMTGWPMRRALSQAAELGIEPEISGSGLIARQEPPPGELVDKGAKVLLFFEPAS
jgi:cell division protein FtsI (penicillin-binding protein 3)